MSFKLVEYIMNSLKLKIWDGWLLQLKLLYLYGKSV